MIKRRVSAILLFLLFSTSIFYGGSQGLVVKTYKLKFVSPREVFFVLKSYVVKMNYSPSSPLITVVIEKEKVKGFEEALKKIDVPKKNILYKVYTIIASKNENKNGIKEPDIAPVLKEIKSLFSFKSYKLDGFSSIIIKERTPISKIRLASNYNLYLYIEHPTIKGASGKREIEFEFSLERGKATNKKRSSILLSSKTSVKNNSFFVAGVSSLRGNSDSIILVIKAEVL